MKKKLSFLILPACRNGIGLFVFFVFFRLPVIAQNIGINSTGATPNSSAMLDVVSTTKGLLIPRVTNAQRTAMNPLPQAAQGLLVYQTDGSEGYYYNTSITTTPNWVYLAPHGKQLFTSSGTFTVPAGVFTVWVSMCGGGGGGAGGCINSTSTFNYYAQGIGFGVGGGGGGADAVIAQSVAVTPGSSIAVTVGSGGSGGAGDGTADGSCTATLGTAGGNSSFGGFITTNGGGAAISHAGFGSRGGSGGSDGSYGEAYGTGNGGGCLFGTGGQASGFSGNGTAGRPGGYGAGGAGGGAFGYPGVAGTSGMVLIEW